VSSGLFHASHFAPPHLTLDVARAHVASAGGPPALLLNLNVPALPAGEIGPVAAGARPAVRPLHRPHSKTLDLAAATTTGWPRGGVRSGVGHSLARLNWPTNVAQIPSPVVRLTPLQPELFARGSVAELPRFLPCPLARSLSPSAGGLGPPEKAQASE